MVLSTMQVHDELVDSGMPEARAVVRVIERQQEDAVTKTDLANLETRFFERLERVKWWIPAMAFGIAGTATGIIIGAIAALD